MPSSEAGKIETGQRLYRDRWRLVKDFVAKLIAPKNVNSKNLSHQFASSEITMLADEKGPPK
jgi:hypothetical protein